MVCLTIISGGQTGVDRAALDAALNCLVPCGGWCPAGRRAEDGPIAGKYPLTETDDVEYSARTLANIRDAQGTLVLCPSGTADRIAETSAGTQFTVTEAGKSGRFLFVAELVPDGCDPTTAGEITAWIRKNRISVLNVAGPRESEAPGIYARAYDLVTNILASIAAKRAR